MFLHRLYGFFSLSQQSAIISERDRDRRSIDDDRHRGRERSRSPRAARDGSRRDVGIRGSERDRTERRRSDDRRDTAIAVLPRGGRDESRHSGHDGDRPGLRGTREDSSGHHHDERSNTYDFKRPELRSEEYREPPPREKRMRPRDCTVVLCTPQVGWMWGVIARGSWVCETSSSSVC